MKNPQRQLLLLYAWALVLGFSEPAAAHRLITLDQAYRLAMKHHPSIKALQERVNQARAARYKAWSPVKPTAGFQATFTRYDEQVAFEVPNPATGQLEEMVFQKENQFGFNVQARLPLFVGSAYPGISMANKMVRIAELTEQDFRRAFQLQVANAYYMVVSQKELARSLEAKVAVDRKHQTAAAERIKAGQSARVERLRAELVTVQDEQALRVARNNLGAARRQLAILLGLAGTVDVRRPAEPASPVRGSAEMLHTALQKRSDFKASALSISAAESGKLASWLSFAPTLDATWLFRWTEAAGFSDKNWSWSLVFSLNVPLYDGGIRYAGLRESESRIREARHKRKALRRTIESQLVRLRKEVASAEAGVISARKALKLAAVTEHDMEASFTAGAATQLDVLDATQRHLEARIGLISGLFKRDMARLALANALGQYDPTRRSR